MDFMSIFYSDLNYSKCYKAVMIIYFALEFKNYLQQFFQSNTYIS